MTASRDPDRLVRAFLLEGDEELSDRVYDAVRAQIEQTRQRAVIGPWRTPSMNKYMTLGLGAAAVVLALVVGAQLLGSSGGNVGGPNDEPTATAEPIATPTAEPTPTSTPWSGLPAGPFDVTGADGAVDGGPVRTFVDIAAPGWTSIPDLDYVYVNDDGLDAPQTVGGGVIAWSFPPGTEFLVYEDPCQWATTIPESPATTPDEIATAFQAQAQTDATEPVHVTIGGYAGKAVTLTVPMSYEVPGATREEEFGECDEDQFVFYGIVGEDSAVVRNAQGPGQVDELMILDVDGSIVILDAVYSPATPPDIIDELRALAESATFELP
ncbi:MAG TPA: hypothetical protein VHQ42_05410 [Candidatus Limnocylindria bacterium]|nr:hypothetical protein [Candidatus Limnocylindria bacterium]